MSVTLSQSSPSGSFCLNEDILIHIVTVCVGYSVALIVKTME